MSKIEELVKKLRKVESSEDLSPLDAKVADKIENKAVSEEENKSNLSLAEQIRKKSTKFNKNRNTNGSGRKIIWASLATLSTFLFVVGVLFMTGILKFPWGEKSSISDYRAMPSAPQMSMQPSNYTQSGYLTAENEFAMEIDGEIKGSLTKIIKIEPEVEFEISELKSEEGKQKLTISPVGDLEEGQEYKIIIPSGTQFSNGAVLINDLVWSYTVNPKFALLGSTPRNGREDVPYDSTIELEFNKNNIDMESVRQNIDIFPEIEGKFTQYGTKVVFAPSRPMTINTAYTVLIRRGIKSLEGEEISYDSKLSFKTTARNRKGKLLENDQYMGLNYQESTHISITDNINETLYQRGFPNDTLFTVSVYSISDDDLIKSILYTDGVLKAVPNEAKLVKSEQYRDIDWMGKSFEYKPERYGNYILKYSNSKNNESIIKVYSYSSVGVFSSYLDGKLEGWVWNMEKEQLVKNATITGYNTHKDRFVGAGSELVDCNGKSDNNGYFKIDSCDLLKVKTDVGTVLASNRASYHFNSNYTTRTHLANIEADKDLYARGDQVEYSVFIKKIAGGVESRSLEGEQVTVYVYGENNFSQRKDIVLDNRYGYINGRFKIPSNSESQYYEIEVEYKGRKIGYKSILVEERAQANHLYTLEVDTDTALRNDEISIKVVGEDYSGMPLVDQKLTLVLYEAKFDQSWMERSVVDYEDYAKHIHELYYYAGDDGTSVMDKKDLTLDVNGQWQLKYKIQPEYTDDLFRAVAVQIRDEGDNTVGQQFILVANYEQNVRLRESVDRTTKPGESARIKLLADRLWRGDSLPEYEFDVRLMQNVREFVPGEPYYDEETKSMIYPEGQIITEKEVDSTTLRTGGDGKVDYVTPELDSGYYNIIIETGGLTKKYENIINVTDVVLGEGGQYSPTLGLNILNEEGSLSPGDKIRYEIQTDKYNNATIFVQSAGIADWRTVKLDGDHAGEFTVPSDAVQGVTVCAYAVGYSPERDELGSPDSKDDNKRFIFTCSYIPVANAGSIVHLEVEADKKQYEPGEEVTLNLVSKDSRGNAITTMIEVDVLDQRIVDLAKSGGMQNCVVEGGARDLIGRCSNIFYTGRNSEWGRHFGSYPIHSFVYGVGGDHYDDESIMSDSRIFRNYGATAKTERNQLRFTKILTDSRGRATVKFTMPNNLTSWAIMARSTDDKDRLGYRTTKIVSKMDRFVDVSMPDFIRGSDKVDIQLVLKNYSDKFSGRIGFDCSGCESGNWEEAVQIDRNSIKTIKTTIRVPANITARNLEIQPYLVINGQKTNQSVATIPVYNASVTSSKVNSGLLDGTESGAKELSMDIDVGNISDELTKVDVCLSPSFPVQDFVSISSANIKSTTELANSLLFYTYMYKNYEELGITYYTQENIYEKVTEYYEMMIENQAESGGFGWFDYDAESLESSVFAAQAAGQMQKEGFTVDNAKLELLKVYFLSILGDDKYPLESKILAINGIAHIQPDLARQYMPVAREAFEQSELVNSPFVISILMQTYNNLGSTGNAQELLPYLNDTAESGQRHTYWKDVDSQYREEVSSDIITSNVYLALAPLDQWQLKYKVRNWLLERNMKLVNSRQDFRRISYVLAAAEQDGVGDTNLSGQLELFVNGVKVKQLDISDAKKTGGCIYSIPLEKLSDGENRVKLQSKDGRVIGEVFVIIKVLKQDDSHVAQSEKIERSYIDLDSGKVVQPDKLIEGKYYVVRLEIDKGDIDSNLVVKDELPAGLRVLENYSYSIPVEIRAKYYDNWPGNFYRYSYGTVTITPRYKYVGGKYQAESDVYYLVRTANSGDYDGGESRYEVSGFDDLTERKSNVRVVIK